MDISTPNLFEPVLKSLDCLPLGLAIYDENDNRIYSNQYFNKLSPDNLKAYHDIVSRKQIGDFELTSGKYPCHLTTHQLPSHYCVTMAPVAKYLRTRDTVLCTLLEALQHSDDLFQRAAEAIAKGLKWRWVGISRFIDDDGNVDVLGWWDTNKSGKPFAMNIFKSPCEAIIRSGKFALFHDIQHQFPHAQMINRMGAKTFAGLVYKNKDQQPVGHILALHDSANVDETLAEDMLHLASIVLSSQYDLLQADAALLKAEQESHSDSLTGLGNRRAFTRDLNMELTLYRMGSAPEALLAIIDLDGMKTVNDTQGHEAGDRLLVMVANILSGFGRNKDNVYRLGGDEFALLLSDAKLAHEPAFRQRLQHAMLSVREHGFGNVDASIGFAQFSEANNDLDQLFQIADMRMYQNKKSKKTANASRASE